MNIINGGAHANNGLRIQEFMIRPDRAKSFSDAMRICFLVINNLRKIIISKGLSTSVGDEGGFAPMINNNNQALDLIVSAIKKSGFVNGKDVSICLDVAANELYKKNKYSIHSKRYLSVEKSIVEYQRIINEYLKVLYWIVFAAFILLFIFMGGWRNIKTYAFIITLIIFPIFLINPLIGFVFSKMQHVAIDYFYLGIGVLIILVFYLPL